MAQQATISARIDVADKAQLDHFCEEIGLSTSALINVFIKKVIREHRIPFTIDADPFYSESNMAFLRESIEQLKTGHAVTKTLEELEAMENA